MHVLVATVVHHPQDARIASRQIRALVAAGHDVTYLAPFSATGSAPVDGVRPVDVPRATGRRRAGALRAARAALRSHGRAADLWLLHDPELLLAVAGLPRPVTVWDVHEDTVAALTLKAWLPPAARPPVALGVRLLERTAERRVRLLLAEEGYRARFRQTHPVVPNTTWVPGSAPPPDEDRVVYVGHLSRARGALLLLDLARLLQDEVRVELVGAADGEVAPSLARARDEGLLDWHGPLPNDEALRRVEGAVAGLSLLADEPNYRHSVPTKVMEYMARGVPVVTTPTPRAQAMVQEHACGVVVPYGDVAAVADAVRALRRDAPRRRELGRRGHEAAAALYDWRRDAGAFVAQLEGWAQA